MATSGERSEARRSEAERVRHGFGLTLCLATSLIAAPTLGVVDAIKAQVIEGPATCGTCQLDFEHVLRIPQDQEDPEAFLDDVVLSVASDSHGRIYVVLNGATRMLVFSTEGRYLGDIGRRGEGPGEFLAPLAVVDLEGDSVGVFDARNARLSVLDSDLVFRRAVSSPPLVGQALHLAGSRIVAAYHSPTQELVGLPLHILDVSSSPAKRLLSFGSLTGAFHQDTPMVRRIAQSDQETVWAAETHRYVIQRWALTGELMQTLSRSPGWFDGLQPSSLGDPTEPPASALRSIAFDEQGRLWVFATRAAGNWQDGWAGGVKPDPRGEGIIAPPLEDLLMTQIEVIDVESGSLIHSETWEAVVVRALGDGIVATSCEDENGVPFVELWRVRLESPYPSAEED